MNIDNKYAKLKVREYLEKYHNGGLKGSIKLCNLSDDLLLEYMKVFCTFEIYDKNKINFLVFKNHLMYLKETCLEKYNYYYNFLSDILCGNNQFLNDVNKININNIKDIHIMFNNLMKNEETFFEDSIILNNILISNGLCPLVLYAFNDIIYKYPVSKNDIKEIIEFSIMYLYRMVSLQSSSNTLFDNNYSLFNKDGAISNIYLKGNKIYKYPKTVASKLFLMQQEKETYDYLSNTDLKCFLAENYFFDSTNKIIIHDFVRGENGEYYLFNHISFSDEQLTSLKKFYNLYINISKSIILDVHPGNFIWDEINNKWVIIDLGVLPMIGREYYDYNSFEEYFENIWLKREETMKKVPIRSLDFELNLDVKDKVLKIE